MLGSTGYIGSAVARRLTADGHHVVHFVKDAGRLGPDAAPRVGDLTDPASLRAAVTDDIDAVPNLATPTGDEVDAAAVGALPERLRGTGRAFVYTSGVWVLGATGDTRSTRTPPVAPAGPRAGRSTRPPPPWAPRSPRPWPWTRSCPGAVPSPAWAGGPAARTS
ncbi:NAD-dependent epimerase/dehydratase family protein [Kitasatospora terrestris]|uniref:NAD-dependent epimerase/dehydratase domain-containing protein n=1 Tax=Kitasatospora terrestris TaxID=258051 RepID=A0ABP9EKB2_9ACTN